MSVKIVEKIILKLPLLKKIIQIRNENIQLRNENIQLRNENTKLRDENVQLCKENNIVKTEYNQINTKLAKYTQPGPYRIVVGASKIAREGWIPTEKEFLNLFRLVDWKKCFSVNSVDAILAEHVWEHFTREEGILTARLCYHYLKPGGYLRIAVPDGFHPNFDYINWVKPNGIGPGCEDHKVLYNYKTLGEIFEIAGFKIDFLEYFSENGEFYYNEWNADAGMIRRSKRFDERNKGNKLKYTSIILDAIKEK